MTAPSPRLHPSPGPWLGLLLLLLGAATFVVVWSSLALVSGRQHGWMALLAALQAAGLLRLGRMRPGLARALLAAAATVLTSACVQWLVASGHIGGQMGMAPWEAAPRMGARYVLLLSQLANNRFDLACLALAPLLALRLGR